MNKRNARTHSNRAGPGQLDLFTRPHQSPPKPSAAAPIVDPPSCTSRGEAASPQKPPSDPLLEYILGSSRGRGRPQKILNAVVASMAEPRRLLDVREAALRLGLSKSTLDKMRCVGRGPRFIKATDRAIRYDPADLEAFAAERRRQTTSQDAAAAALRS